MSEQLRRDLEPTETHWPYERLKEALISACGHERFRRGIVPFDRLPSTVDVGKFGGKALECVQATATDRKERGLGIEFLPVDRKIVMDRQLVVGEESKVAVGYPRSINDLYFQQLAKLPTLKRVLADGLTARLAAEGLSDAQRSERLIQLYQLDTVDGRIVRDITPARIGNVHSHTNPTPVSYFDLVTFLSTPELRIMIVGRPDGYSETIMKTDETTAIDAESKDDLSGRWSRLLDERVEHGVRQERLSHLEANQRAQTALARSIANKYKFGYFAGTDIGSLSRVQ